MPRSKGHKKRVEEANMKRALDILERQGYTLRRVYFIPYHPQDIFGADILATNTREFKLIQVTNKQFYKRRADKMRIPLPHACIPELWVWKDPTQFKKREKGCFYVYNLDEVKIREEA